MGGGEEAWEARTKGGIGVSRRAAGGGDLGGRAGTIRDWGAGAVRVGVAVGADAPALVVSHKRCASIGARVRILTGAHSVGASGSIRSGNDDESYGNDDSRDDQEEENYDQEDEGPQWHAAAPPPLRSVIGARGAVIDGLRPR